MHGTLRLRGHENGERDGGTTEVKQATTAGGDILIVAGAETEEVAKLVMALAEPLRRSEALEAPHTSDAAFDAPMILFQSVILSVRPGTGRVI
jgi:hypothetical protein